MTYYDFNKDYKRAEKAENEILAIIHKKYPKAYRIKGYFKSYDIYIPEVNKRVEVKRDFLAYKTDNYFIETHYGGEESGISTTEADYYVIVDDKVILWVETETLRYLIENGEDRTFPAKDKDKKTRTGKLIKRDSLILNPYIVCYKREEVKDEKRR